MLRQETAVLTSLAGFFEPEDESIRKGIIQLASGVC
jgi:hypothetical protein